MKRAIESFGYLSVGAARVFFGAVALGAIWHWQKRRWPLVKKDILPLVGVSLVGYAVPFTLQPYIVSNVEDAAGHGSAFGGMLVSFVPLLTILVSIPLLGIYPTKRQLIGVVGGFIGIYALFAAELSHDVPLRLLLVGSVTPLCYATANTYTKRRFEHVPVMALAFSELTITTMMLAPLAGSMETIKHNEALTTSIVSLMILGVLCTGIATAMFYKLIQGHGPLFAGMVAYIIPCVAMLVGYLDGEKIAANQVAAIVSIFVMVAVVQYRSPSASAQALKPEIEP